MDIPMLDWIDGMLGTTLQQFAQASDEQQFQAALRAMVVTTFVRFKASYFLGLSKCFLIPEQHMKQWATTRGVTETCHKIQT